MSSEERIEFTRTFRAEGKVGKAFKNIAMVSLRPEDFSSPGGASDGSLQALRVGDEDV